MKHIITIISLFLALAATGQTNKLSPYVRKAMATDQSAAMKAKRMGKTHKAATITAFVRTSDIDALRKAGCTIYAQWDDIVIAAIPLNNISSLASLSAVQRIEAGEPCFINNDTTAIVTRARDVWNGSASRSTSIPAEIKGNGVVVGVMDIGFDLTHPTFYSADGQRYRVKALWDQLDSSTNGDIVATNNDEDTHIGRQYIGTDALLAKQYSTDGLTQTHGTHTTGTAAGSGLTTATTIAGKSFSRSGMAPEADICLVANYAGDNKDLIPESDRWKYTTATDMLGFKYIFDYAESVGKPCVINFSEGAHDDLYESGLYQEVMSKLVGPGRILCASAGNEGAYPGYIHKPKGREHAGAFINKAASKALYVMRSDHPVTMQLTFYSPQSGKTEWTYCADELSEYPDSVMADTIIVDGKKYEVLLNTYPSCYDENSFATDFLISNLQDEILMSHVMPLSLKIIGKDNDIEVFGAGGYFASNKNDPSLCDYTTDHNILFPGSLEGVICVGNSSYRTGFLNHEGIWQEPFQTGQKDGEISIYSSKGPAISGRMKPDVCAPGMNIISSLNSFFRENNPTANKEYDVCYTTFNGRTYPWGEESGTSMSSPCVVGIVALWLQVCPTLSPEQVLDVIAHTSSHYDDSLTYPNTSYGHGQIDAVAGLEYVMENYTGIKEIKHHDATSNDAYDICGRRIMNPESYHGIIVTRNGKYIK